MALYSKRNHHAGLSLEHNEYMALTAITKAVIWLRQFLHEAGFEDEVKEPTILFGENVQANKLSREHFVSTGNMYIYLPYHFVREASRMQLIEVKWVQGAFNMADAFTKALTAQQMKNILAYILGYASAEEYKQRMDATLDQAAMKAFKRG